MTNLIHIVPHSRLFVQLAATMSLLPLADGGMVDDRV